MRKQLYSLGDAHWKRLEALLPSGRRGAHRADDWLVICGIAQHAGASWRDYPPEYGPTRRFTTASAAGAERVSGSSN
ncbi:transposase [Bradyrhizobium sp. USDA 10063]